MIVDPDFLDHWKTRLLIEEMGDAAAPLYLLRLWAHCQNRRTDTFDLSAAALKALCHFPGHANKLESSLVASGFVRRDGPSLIVHEWSDYNASLISSWTNGKKGGRPKKPKRNPPVSGGIPTANPSETDKIRVDEIRSDEIGNKKGESEIPSVLDTPEFVRAWSEWGQHRTEKRIALTPMAVKKQLRKLAAIGSDRAVAAIDHSIANSYTGIFEENSKHGKSDNRVGAGQRFQG